MNPDAIARTNSGPGELRPLPFIICILVALVMTGEISTEPDLRNALSRSLFFGAMGLPEIVVIAIVISSAIRRLTRRYAPQRVCRYLIVVTIISITAMVVDATIESRPARFFVRITHYPAFDSISDITASRSSSFSEGDAWFFRFNIARIDLDRLIRNHGFEPLADALDRPVLKDHDGWNFAERVEDYVRDHAGDLYQRPEHPQIFRSANQILITNSEHTVANLFIDRFTDEPIKTLLEKIRPGDAR